MPTIEATQLPLVLHLAPEDPGNREDLSHFFSATTRLADYYDHKQQVIPTIEELCEQNDALRPLMTDPTDPNPAPTTYCVLGGAIVGDDGGPGGD